VLGYIGRDFVVGQHNALLLHLAPDAPEADVGEGGGVGPRDVAGDVNGEGCHVLELGGFDRVLDHAMLIEVEIDFLIGRALYGVEVIDEGFEQFGFGGMRASLRSDQDHTLQLYFASKWDIKYNVSIYFTRHARIRKPVFPRFEHLPAILGRVCVETLEVLPVDARVEAKVGTPVGGWV